MSEKINIQAGAGMRKILSTTLPLNKALTELIKNSIQNDATWVRINLNKNDAFITDNGSGFDHIKDKEGRNEFEKYFIFGNSTENKTNLNLGAMGIGGKVANDKLSDINNTHWEIHSKNKHNKYFKLTFKSSKEKLLTDISPNIKELPVHTCPVKSPTGTQIVIKTLNENVRKNGWEMEEIKSEIQSFFNLLITQLREQNKNFSVKLNNQEIKFSNKIGGSALINEAHNFPFELEGKKLNAKVHFNISKGKEILSSVDIFSYTRVGRFSLNTALSEKVSEKLKLKQHWPHADTKDVINFYNENLCGFLSCNEIQDCKTQDGLTAKDLSHHRLNPDHPLSKAFVQKCHEVILRKIWPIVSNENNPEIKNNRILKSVSDIINNNFELPSALTTEKEETHKKTIET